MTADVTLAQFGEQVWLVGGDEHIDDLLANTMPPGTTIEFVSVTERREVRAMWERMSTEQTDGAEPWVIHPLIVRRIRGDLGPRSVAFSPWSAMLDTAAQDAIGAAADWLAARPGATITLRQHCGAEPPPGLTDLQRLRGQLVAGALTRGGADAAQLHHETLASAAETDTERLDLITTDA